MAAPRSDRGRFWFFRNPYRNARLVRCPKLGGPTKAHQRALVIDV